MTTAPTAVPAKSQKLRGAAYGVTVLAFFAMGWLGWGTGGHLPAAAQVTLMVAALLTSVALVWLAWRRWRTTTVPAAPAGTEPATPAESRRAVGRSFGIIVAAEWIGVAAAAMALGVTGHPHLIPAVVCAGVGLHFIPLARLFRVWFYHATAAAMCLLAVATFALAPATPALWTILPGVGSAVVLYATCGLLLTWRPHTS